jgi:hypothetical protein
MQDVGHPKLCCPPVDKFPSDFPQTECDWLSTIVQGVEEGRLPAFTFGFPDLILAVEYAHRQVLFMHQWNKGETLKFLEYHCINKNVQVHIYEQAEKCRMLRVALKEGSHFTEEENMVIHQDARHLKGHLFGYGGITVVKGTEFLRFDLMIRHI